MNWYTYCGNDPERFIDPSGLSIQDILYGATEALDETLTDGLAKWIVSKFQPDRIPNAWIGDSAKDYYTGRVIGGVLSFLIGAGMAIKGIIDIIGSIAAGGAITIGSGGILVDLQYPLRELLLVQQKSCMVEL